MATEEEVRPILPRRSSSRHWGQVKKKTMFMRAIAALALLTTLVCGIWILQHFWNANPSTPTKPDFEALRGYCADIPDIQPSEYAERQKKLAETLVAENASAYVLEPGPTMLYYTNIVWSLSERPFVVVLRPDPTLPTGINTTVVTPMFEATRAVEAVQAANLPKAIQPHFVAWLEHHSPYDAVAEVVGEGRVFVEPSVRLFVFDGISKRLGGANVQMASRALQVLRMVKSKAELDIMRCVNHATEYAIRLVRPHVAVGMTEDDIAQLMESALATAGLTNTWVLALIDENAAFPHGEPGKEKRVKATSTVLVDTGGELLGYQSDTTRTFFIGEKGSHNNTIVDAWYTVKHAQTNVLRQARVGSQCAEVDLAARRIIEKAGFGPYFTHRLGHGIGEEMHEEPYMNQGNTEQTLEPGMTFSVEPGIYVNGEFGIRLEDIVVVTEEGHLELLTSGLADNPWTL